MSGLTPKRVRFRASHDIQGLTFDWFPVSSTHKEQKGRHDSNNRTLVLSSLLPNLTPPRHSKNDAQKSDRHDHRLGTKIGKYVRGFLQSSRHVSVTAVTKIVGRREGVAEKPIPGTETTDQREEEVTVHEDCVPYVVSQPIPNGKMLRKVVITVVSKDQGWSTYMNDYGTYRNSWTWFELSVGPPRDSGERWRSVVVRNLHAHSDFKEHTIEISDRELYEKAESGDVLTIWAHARFQGWKNTVKKATIRYVVE